MFEETEQGFQIMTLQVHIQLIYANTCFCLMYSNIM